MQFGMKAVGLFFIAVNIRSIVNLQAIAEIYHLLIRITHLNALTMKWRLILWIWILLVKATWN